MLNPSTIIDSNNTTEPVIAGNTSGVKVHCTREALPVYNALVKIARSGNHHARLAVSGIVGLSRGHLHMDNIYKPSSRALSNSRNEVFMAVLPGIRVIYRQKDNGTFTVLKIDVDDAYTKQQKEATSPGLWNATKADDEWNASFVKDGKLNPNAKNKFVVISDRSSRHPTAEAASIFKVLQGSRDKTTVTQIGNDGFDLHYTPGEKSIGGMKNMKEVRHANNQASLKESAEILAHTMHNARDISGVVWGSESGGSGVLTQAMQILADRGVTLDTHGIFLNRATTLPSKAVELARKLESKSDRVDKKSTISLDQLAGQLCFFDTPVSNLERLKNDDDYTTGSLAKDTVQGTFNAVNNSNSVIGAAGLLGFSLASSPVVATVGGILALTTVVTKTLENIMPETSRKHLGGK
jgi:hypothetical protein